MYFIIVSLKDVEGYIYTDGEDVYEEDDEEENIDYASISSFGESTSVEDNWVVDDNMDEEGIVGNNEANADDIYDGVEVNNNVNEDGENDGEQRNDDGHDDRRLRFWI